MSIYEKEGGETIPYVNKYTTAHIPKGRECPTIYLVGRSPLGEGGSALGGNPRFSTLCMKPCYYSDLVSGRYWET